MDDLQDGENSKAGKKTCKVTLLFICERVGYGNIYIFACILKCNDTLQLFWKMAIKGEKMRYQVDFSEYTF